MVLAVGIGANIHLGPQRTPAAPLFSPAQRSSLRWGPDKALWAILTGAFDDGLGPGDLAPPDRLECLGLKIAAEIHEYPSRSFTERCQSRDISLLTLCPDW